ncbi:MAG TPA: MtrB/PioB family outer membrane beta-barrel protein [Burkholderiales bacterium]|nr:MtrB/PioB family outer membrane beta-barrel protein [Burkholderiales bacterium]
MRAKLIAILVANLLAASPLAFAEEGDVQWSGSVTVGARIVDDKADDNSKFNEYRDVGSGALFGDFEFRGRSDRGYLNVYGENFGRENQYLDLKGGAYGVFKYRLYSDELRHNFGAGPGALSPFSGIGSGTLSATLPNSNIATWNTFDHSYTRRDVGGFAEWQATSPWYFRVDTNQVKREGINVFAGANGTSPGNGFTDLPAPIDYVTTNVSGEFGYSTKRGSFAVNLLHSKFENGHDVLRWNNGFFANGLDTTVLPPDNKLSRLGVNGTLRQLPWNSTFAGRLMFSQLTNDVAVQQTMLHTGGAILPSFATPGTFHGDIKRTNLSLSFSSRPTRNVDTRAYLDYAKEENGSSHMTFPGTALTGGPCTAVSCSPEPYDYKRTKVGVEGGYRLSRENKLSGGLEYSDAERDRIDFTATKDTRFFAQWKNSSVDWLTGRVKYQVLSRKSDFNTDIVATSGNPTDLYVRRFDLANVSQNQLKLILDATVAPRVDLGFEAIFKDNDYKDTLLGRTNDTRQEYYVSASFGNPNEFRVLVFGDVEVTKYESFHRVGTGPTAADPFAAPTASTYNWGGTSEDKSWQLGLGMDWKPRERLTLKASLIVAKTEGTADFSPEVGGGGPFASITNIDNTKRTSLNFKGIYAYDRNWEFTGGYAYEKYEYDDIAYNGTRYVTTATATAGVVTGQYSFQPYKASILYAMAKYNF